MIPRDITQFVTDNTQWFPVLSVTGPRQSGKSTLVKNLFSHYEYCNLEMDSTYRLAKTDPSDFITSRPDRLIIDEAQRVPEIFHAIQVASDERGTTGQYILSGSQNFLLLKQITQSLAGRVGIVRLLPLSYNEVLRHNSAITPEQFMFRGGYPRLHNEEIPLNIFYRNYLSTYVERDVRGLIDASNTAQFRTFLRLCAHNVGSLVNLSRMAQDVGVTRPTIDSWLNILEASYIVFRLQPYHANLRKRLTKTPKIYFYDTGLLCYLLGIRSDEALRDSPKRGLVFENFIIQETIKHYDNSGEEAQLFFYRDDNKREIDLIDASDEHGDGLKLIEIKSTTTYKSSYTRALHVIGDELNVPLENRQVVWRGENAKTQGIGLQNVGTYLAALATARHS